MLNIVTGDTPEAVAYALFLDCLRASDAGGGVGPNTGMPETDILALYGRCLATVRGDTNHPIRADRTG